MQQSDAESSLQTAAELVLWHSSVQLGNEEIHLYGPCQKLNASLPDFLIAAGDVCRLR